MSRNNTILILIIALAVLAFCCLVTLCGAFFAFFAITSASETQPTPIVQYDDTPRPTPTPRMRPTATSLPSTDQDESTPAPVNSGTESQLIEVVAPSHDPRDVAARLKPELGEIPLVVNDETPVYEEGDVIEFWAGNTDTDENFRVNAELLVKSENLYMWVEEGVDVDVDDLRRSAELFDQVIYPTDREFFGSEWTPGIDNDPRLHILHAHGLGNTVAGYYSSADEVSSLVNPYSNEKEMFYINLDNNRPGSTFYDATLAHEFQHMIHWNEDLNESTWLNEGASELATQLTDLFRSGDSYLPDQAFADNPDIQLNTWPDSDESYAHYGNAYLFMNYFLSRFGEDASKALVAEQANGMESVDAVMQDLGIGLTSDEIFADWVIANWLDDPSLEDGRWGYPDYDPSQMNLSERHRQLPASGTGEVHQYAADYIRVRGDGDLRVDFSGNATTRLAATDAYSGEWAWWGNRVDESDTRLTLPVDLSDVDEATLQFRTWYDIEENWDYAYVMVSEDNGDTWTLLETDMTTRENPQGNAYGPGYTGPSGGWVLQEVDLSPYAGQPIQVRFEYITDAAVTGSGMFIDDVAIPEIGYFEDFESGPGDWQSEGWLLTDNTLNQRWIVQIVETKPNGEVQVHQVPVAADGVGSLDLFDVDRSEDLILVISALAPVTIETANYEYRVSSQ
ncbi:MAG: immune inhibitor A [Caldilineales bacterium]|nr:immune inhibitor A [Caldilineales bacterium]